MKIVIGLGNVGDKYRCTRHNIGFMFLDRLAASDGKAFLSDRLYDYAIIKQTVLIKPKTYMNRSGLALEAARSRWTTDDVLVVYDDIELPVSDLRFRTGGGDGGHNGIKSLVQIIKPSELKRIRIGIGKNTNVRAEQYVLSDIPEDERVLYERVFEHLIRFVRTYIARDFSSMLDEYSKWKKTYSDSSDIGIISPKEDNND